jgi:site-specific DNA-methyltransferase (adenine-specific)
MIRLSKELAGSYCELMLYTLTFPDYNYRKKDDGMYKLHLGDCLEYMAGMADGSVDAVITDPPYGIDFLGNDWDKTIPDWIGSARRIGKLVIFTTAPTTLWDYPRPDWVAVWHRKHSSSRQKSGGFNLWSPIVVYGQIKIPADLYTTHFGTYWREHKKIDHPSPKPEELYRWIIEWSTNPNDTIFDPFMGSGTTGVACAQTGRNFIGCEIDPDYFAIAEKRIRNAYAQPLLI